MILESVKGLFERTPPELTSDVCDRGITLTGGGARLAGIAQYAEGELGIKVNVAERPLESVCLGIGRMMESDGKLGEILNRRS